IHVLRRERKTSMPGTSPGMTRKRSSYLRRHRYRREIDEPALGLHEALDLWAQRARADVVRDIEERRVIDGGRMQLGQRLVAFGGIERLPRLLHQFVEFRVVDEAPII